MRYSALSKYRSELMGSAMLWVMLFHTALEFRIPALALLQSTGFGGVDIFIVLSALGLVISLSKSEQPWKVFMARRAVRILPAYFVVMLVDTVFSIVRGTTPLSTLLWNSTLLSYWVQAEGGFNWYISGIMLFYMVTPLCFRRLKQAKHRTALTALCIMAGVVLYRILITFDVWAYLDLAYRIPVYFLGLLLGFYVFEDRPLSKKSVLFWCGWFVCGAAYYMAVQHLSPHVVVLPLGPLFLFTTVPMCLAFCWLFDRLPLGWLRRILRLVGENSLEIYLLNVSLFSGAPLLQRFLSVCPIHSAYYLLAILLNILLGVWLHRAIAWIISRLKP